MVRPFAALCILVAAAFVALPAQAQWKWRDKSGHTQYSDLPPPQGTPDADILGRPARQVPRAVPASGAASAIGAGSAPAAGPLTARTADPELEAKRKKAESDLAAKAKLDEQRIAAARAENCSRARGQLRQLDAGTRLTRTNEKGEREYLDDAARAAEAKRTQEIVASDCK